MMEVTQEGKHGKWLKDSESCLDFSKKFLGIMSASGTLELAEIV